MKVSGKHGRLNLAVLILIPVVMLLLVIPVSYGATLPDLFSFGLDDFNSFMQEDNPWMPIIDFFFFLCLFTTVYMIGVRSVFKDAGRIEKSLAVILAFATSFLLVLANVSIAFLIPVIHYLFYFLLFVMFWWVLKGVKNNIVRFLVALLLTVLVIWLLSMLVEGSTPNIRGPSGINPPGHVVGQVFSPAANAFRTISFKAPSVPTEAIDKLMSGPTGQRRDQLVAKPTAQESDLSPSRFSIPSWIWMVLVVAVLIVAFLFLRRRRSDLDKKSRYHHIAHPYAFSTDDIEKKLTSFIGCKNDVRNQIKTVLDWKTHHLKDFDSYLASIPTDPAEMWNRNHRKTKEYRQWVHERQELGVLIHHEFELEDLLHELAKIEHRLVGSQKEASVLLQWMQVIIENYDPLKKRVLEMFEQIKANPYSIEVWHGFMAEVGRLYHTRGKDEHERRYLEGVRQLYAQIGVLLVKDQHDDDEVGVVHEVKNEIHRYFLLTRSEDDMESMLLDLEKHEGPKGIQHIINSFDRWKKLQHNYFERLGDYIDKEKKLFEGSEKIGDSLGLNKRIEIQVKHLEKMLRLIRTLTKHRPEQVLLIEQFPSSKVRVGEKIQPQIMYRGEANENTVLVGYLTRGDDLFEVYRQEYNADGSLKPAVQREIPPGLFAPNEQVDFVVRVYKWEHPEEISEVNDIDNVSQGDVIEPQTDESDTHAVDADEDLLATHARMTQEELERRARDQRHGQLRDVADTDPDKVQQLLNKWKKQEE